MTIETAVGPVQVLHRLALGVEPVDAVTRQRPSAPVRVRREVPVRRRPGGASPLLGQAPGIALERGGPARFKLRHGRGVGERVTLRIDDPRRRWVCRRLDVALWTRDEVESADGTPPGPLVPVSGRLLRPWLMPGPAWPAPLGTSGLRGRLLRMSRPVRWARLRARGPDGSVLGWAHGDERGEFLLVLTTAGGLPASARSALDVTLDVAVPRDPPDEMPDDPGADLVVEAVPRALGQPAPGSQEHQLLTGRRIPDDYVLALTAAHAVPTGEVLALHDIPLH